MEIRRMSPAMSDRHLQHEAGSVPAPGADRIWSLRDGGQTDFGPVGQALLMAAAVEFAGADGSRFRGINLSLHKHEAAWISGASSMERSKLLRILCGLECPIGGEVYWKEMRMGSAARSLHAELAFLDRSGGIRAMLTPREHLQFHLRVRGSCPRLSPEQALNRVGLVSVIDVPCGRLTSAQQWRVSFARLLVTKATLWAIEEPCDAMNATEFDLLRRLATDHIADRGVAVFSGPTSLMPVFGEIRLINLDEHCQ
jgi:heme exporter protein A